MIVDYFNSLENELDFKEITYKKSGKTKIKEKQNSLILKNKKINIISSKKLLSKCKVILKSIYVAEIRLNDRYGNPYVINGQKISRGTKICEFQYLNIEIEINSPCEGIIDDIFVNNNSIVQYGEKIMSISTFNA